MPPSSRWLIIACRRRDHRDVWRSTKAKRSAIHTTAKSYLRRERHRRDRRVPPTPPENERRPVGVRVMVRPRPRRPPLRAAPATVRIPPPRSPHRRRHRLLTDPPHPPTSPPPPH